MENQIDRVISYRDFTITITKDFCFEIGADDGARSVTTCATMAEAKRKIDDIIKTRNKQEKVALALPALTDTGEPITVRGVHGGHGKVLFDRPYEGGFYPNVEWLARLLAERQQLSKRVAKINQLTDRFRLRRERSYGRLAPDAYDSVVKNLEAEFANKGGEATTADVQAA